ncbi:MAG: HAD family phosphatase [Burkholderiales bacterium]|nr:HAD family phosphatase [Burkholderiales bacterium]
MQIINTIFWDLDGTLINSEKSHNNAGFEAFKLLNINLINHEIPAGIENRGAFELLTGLRLDSKQNIQLFDKWEKLTIELVISYINKDMAIKQSLELFHYFYEAGLYQAIVSNSNYIVIKHSLKEIGIFDKVDNIHARDFVTNGKPHPELYLTALKSQSSNIANCLTFEDSNTGITAALRAGINVVGINNSSNNTIHALSINCDNWISQLEKLYSF